MRFPASQILLVLFVELKPICLFSLTFALGLAPGFSVHSMVQEVIGLLKGLTPLFADESPVLPAIEMKGLLHSYDRSTALKGLSRSCQSAPPSPWPLVHLPSHKLLNLYWNTKFLFLRLSVKGKNPAMKVLELTVGRGKEGRE